MTRLLIPASPPSSRSWLTAWTGCRLGVKCKSPAPADPAVGNMARGEANEPFTHLHRAPGGDFVADGGDSVVGRGRLFSVAGFGSAAGRLSDDSSPHVLPRRQPGRHGF